MQVVQIVNYFKEADPEDLLCDMSDHDQIIRSCFDAVNRKPSYESNLRSGYLYLCLRIVCPIGSPKVEILLLNVKDKMIKDDQLVEEIRDLIHLLFGT